MKTVPNDLVEALHKRILEAASRYKKCEAEMIDLIQQADTHKIYKVKGYSSLFEYVIKGVRLSESAAGIFIGIARKAAEVPELKLEIQTGAISVSNARRIVPVLTCKNKEEWLSKAKNLSQRQLEKEVIKVRPEVATPERVKYVTSERVKLEVGFSEKDMLGIRKLQDILCQKTQKSVSLEEAICIVVEDYLKRHDPVQKAKRHTVRKLDLLYSSSVKFTRSRAPISKRLLHAVNLRDQRRCTHVGPDGTRCSQKRWLDIHHIVPVSHGGQNTLENLTTLCSTHHDYIHMELANR
jgi:5-methylcytosine-specific restriction endonuclease McrA